LQLARFRLGKRRLVMHLAGPFEIIKSFVSFIDV